MGGPFPCLVMVFFLTTEVQPFWQFSELDLFAQGLSLKLHTLYQLQFTVLQYYLFIYLKQ